MRLTDLTCQASSSKINNMDDVELQNIFIVVRIACLGYRKTAGSLPIQ